MLNGFTNAAVVYPSMYITGTTIILTGDITAATANPGSYTQVVCPRVSSSQPRCD